MLRDASGLLSCYIGRNRSSGNPQAIDKSREQLKSCRRCYQFDDLRIGVHTLQFPEKRIVNFLERTMQTLRAAETELLFLSERASLEIRFRGCDLVVARTFLFGRKRMRGDCILRVLQSRKTSRHQLLIPARQGAVTEQRF